MLVILDILNGQYIPKDDMLSLDNSVTVGSTSYSVFPSALMIMLLSVPHPLDEDFNTALSIYIEDNLLASTNG